MPATSQKSGKCSVRSLLANPGVGQGIAKGTNVCFTQQQVLRGLPAFVANNRWRNMKIAGCTWVVTGVICALKRRDRNARVLEKEKKLFRGREARDCTFHSNTLGTYIPRWQHTSCVKSQSKRNGCCLMQPIRRPHVGKCLPPGTVVLAGIVQ